MSLLSKIIIIVKKRIEVKAIYINSLNAFIDQIYILVFKLSF